MVRAKRSFKLIDPLNPPSPNGEFGALASVIAESAIWFFSDPSDKSPGVRRSGDPPTVGEIVEAINAARDLLKTSRPTDTLATVTASMAQQNPGWALADLFCGRFVAKRPVHRVTLSTGRVIGQRQLLCAFALMYADKTALAIRERRATDVCNLMWNLLELTCEIRRALDREAGSTIAARRARQRHEKTYQMRARAWRLYDERRDWPSVRKAAQTIHPKIVTFAKSIGARLSEDSGENTVYNWLRAHKKTTAA